MTITLTINTTDTLKHNNKAHAKRIVLSINAIIYSLDIIENKFDTIETALIQVHKNNILKGTAALHPRGCTIKHSSKTVNRIIANCWELVDWVDRLRKLLGYAAGLKKQEEWYKNLTRDLKSVTQIRHFIQHFDGELNKYVSGSFPLMGTILATFPVPDGVCMEILLSSPAKTPYDENTTIHDFKFPESATGEIDHITFCLEKKSVNISNLIQSIRNGKENMIGYLENEYDFTWPTLTE